MSTDRMSVYERAIALIGPQSRAEAHVDRYAQNISWMSLAQSAHTYS